MRELIVIAFGIAMSFAAVIGVFDILTQNQCSNYQEETGTQTRYRHLDSCYLKTAQGWMPWAEFKVRAMSREVQ